MDEWQGGKEDKERKELNQKFDQAKVAAILNKRKGIQVREVLAYRDGYSI